MLSFHVKFVQTDRQMDDKRTDRRTPIKQFAPDLSIWGHKSLYKVVFLKSIHKCRSYAQDKVNFNI